MKVHANAPLGPKGRLIMVRRVVEQRLVVRGGGRGRRGERAHVLVGGSIATAPRARRGCWIAPRHRGRFRIARLTSWVEVIVSMRRLRMTGAPRSRCCLAMALSTVSAVLLRVGLGNLWRLEPPEPPNRYERRHPGELITSTSRSSGASRAGRAGHASTVSVGCNAARARTARGPWAGSSCMSASTTPPGWPTSRSSATRRAAPPSAFLAPSGRVLTPHGISVERVMSDNGACYRSTIHAFACRALGVRHLRTRPYRPRTNGKAERFIRTLLAGWAYGAIYGSSRERTAALDGWLWTYNHRRPHGSLSHKTPDRSPHRAEQRAWVLQLAVV